MESQTVRGEDPGVEEPPAQVSCFSEEERAEKDSRGQDRSQIPC